MELVDGESLQARLARGPLPVEDVLRHGAEIASALDRAHKNGIAHRDLKPGNVMLTKSGIKLIDFGLARSIAATVPASGSESATATAHAALTGEGAVVGTPQYMAPEQLEGKPADARTDVFALGGVLHEMVAGKPAFSGGSAATLASEILRTEAPPLTTLRADCPPALERVVRACLVKDPDERLQSAHDVKLLLEGLTDVPHAAQQPGRASRRATWLPWAVAALAIGLALAATAAQGASARGCDRLGPLPGPAPGRGHLHRLVRGHHVLLLSQRTHAGVQRGRRRGHAPLPASARLARGEAAARNRGRALGLLVAGRKGARLLRQQPAEAAGAQRGSARHRLQRAAEGRDHRDLGRRRPDPVRFDRGRRDLRGQERGRRAPEGAGAGERRGARLVAFFLPDGKRYLYLQRSPDRAYNIMLGEAGREPRAVRTTESLAQYLAPGYLVFARDGTLLAQRFDADSARVSGDPIALAEPVAEFASPGWAAFAVSATGAIAYQSPGGRARLSWFDRAGHRQPLDNIASPLSVRVSPDGSRALFNRNDPRTGDLDIWALEIARGGETRITSDVGTETAGLLMPDGSLVYSQARGRSPRLQRRDLATGETRALLPDGSFQEVQDYTPDGTTSFTASATRPPGTSSRCPRRGARASRCSAVLSRKRTCGSRTTDATPRSSRTRRATSRCTWPRSPGSPSGSA